MSFSLLVKSSSSPSLLCLPTSQGLPPFFAALSVAVLFHLSITEVGTPTDSIFLIFPLRRERLSERLCDGRGEREGKITRSFEQRKTSCGGGQAIFPLSRRLISAGGGWLHKQHSSSLPLFILALPSQTCCNLGYTNSSKASKESLTSMGQGMSFFFSPLSLCTRSQDHMFLCTKSLSSRIINWVWFLFTTLGGSRA